MSMLVPIPYPAGPCLGNYGDRVTRANNIVQVGSTRVKAQVCNY